jgi:hypothetical protein
MQNITYKSNPLMRNNFDWKIDFGISKNDIPIGCSEDFLRNIPVCHEINSIEEIIQRAQNNREQIESQQHISNSINKNKKDSKKRRKNWEDCENLEMPNIQLIFT